MNTTRRDAHINYSGNQMTIIAPYDEGFKSDLMSRTVSRRWDPKNRAWTVDIRERSKALEVVKGFFTVIEDNVPTASDRLTQPEPQDPVSTERPLQVKAGEHVEMWTDGACVDNPGPGGYAAVFHHNGLVRELAGGYRLTTNNRMEIMAAIAALEALTHKCRVTLYSDSRYLADAVMKGWAKRWQSNGWKRNRKEKALNADLWERLLGLCDRHEVELSWVKGHASSPENARCDQMAEAAARKASLPVDSGFENEQTTIL